MKLLPKIISRASVILMEYEICYLIGESKEAEAEKIKEKIKEIVAGESGSFLDFEFIDKRKMAYEIKNEMRGTFMANRFKISKKDNKQESETGSKSAIDSLTEKLYLEKDILRFIIVKADSVPVLEDKREAEKRSSNKLQAVNDKREKEGSARQFEKPIEKKPLKKTAKKEKTGNISKKLEEILNI